jgi:hypothetical protein
VRKLLSFRIKVPNNKYNIFARLSLSVLRRLMFSIFLLYILRLLTFFSFIFEFLKKFQFSICQERSYDAHSWLKRIVMLKFCLVSISKRIVMLKLCLVSISKRNLILKLCLVSISKRNFGLVIHWFRYRNEIVIPRI